MKEEEGDVAGRNLTYHEFWYLEVESIIMSRGEDDLALPGKK